MLTLNRKGLKYFLAGIVTALMSTLVVLLLLEAYVRIFYPEIKTVGTSRELVIDNRFGVTPGLRPLSAGLCDGVLFSVDALGFWKYSGNARTEQPGWLLLGDSVTMGIGVDPDSTFSGRVAAMTSNVRILNPSWLGYSSSDYVAVATALLRNENLSPRKPTIQHLTLFWTLNDVYSNFNIALSPGTEVREYGSFFYLALKRYFRAYEWLKTCFYDRSRDYFEFDKTFYHTGDPRFVRALSDLDSLKRLCNAKGVQFDVVLMPYEYQLRQRESSSFAPQALLASALDSMRVQHFDSTPMLVDAAQNSKALYQFGDGIHFSKRGHELIARYICGVFHVR